SENRMFERPENISGKSFTGKPRHYLPENNDISDFSYYKDHARINHHHQSSDAREEFAETEQPLVQPVIDDDDDDSGHRLYRGVDTDQLIHDVPDLAGYVNHPDTIRGAIDVVLGRSRGRVGNPTAYVRKALRDDLWGVLAEIDASATAQSLLTSTSAVNHTTEAATNTFQEARGVNGGISPSGSSEGLTGDVLPVLDDLPDGALPCMNMDHLSCYTMTARQLADCPYCRIEQATGVDDYPHVAKASAAAVAGLPARLRTWVAQFQTGDHQPKVGVKQ